MYEGLDQLKEKRRKRLSQKNRKKMTACRKFEKNRKGIKQVLYEDQDVGNWELINSR